MHGQETHCHRVSYVINFLHHGKFSVSDYMRNTKFWDTNATQHRSVSHWERKHLRLNLIEGLANGLGEYVSRTVKVVRAMQLTKLLLPTDQGHYTSLRMVQAAVNSILHGIQNRLANAFSILSYGKLNQLELVWFHNAHNYCFGLVYMHTYQSKKIGEITDTADSLTQKWMGLYFIKTGVHWEMP